LIKEIDTDIYHITSGLPHLIKFLPKSKTIFTVHDINRYIFDLRGVRKILYKFFYLNYLKKYDYLTTISESVKNELIKKISLEAKKINVIYNCYSLNFTFCEKEFNKKCPSILHVGTKPWKNLSRLILALKDIECKLIIIGKIDENDILLLKTHDINFENYHNLSYSEIKMQYEKCDLVSFISLYEGFGMPIIEAQAIGRVVVTSNVSSMPEIANNAALLVNPNSVYEINKSIKKIINNDNYRNDLIEKGKINITRFNPKIISRKYIDLYSKIINNNDSN
jgi:glycosyltransferase involved in cell wall biosynthesis